MSGTRGRVHDVRNALGCLRCGAAPGCAACFERNAPAAVIAVAVGLALLNEKTLFGAVGCVPFFAQTGPDLRCLVERGVQPAFAERGARRCGGAAWCGFLMLACGSSCCVRPWVSFSVNVGTMVPKAAPIRFDRGEAFLECIVWMSYGGSYTERGNAAAGERACRAKSRGCMI